MSFPLNKCIRIQGANYNEHAAWRGNIIIGKFCDHDAPFTSMMDASIAVFPSLLPRIPSVFGNVSPRKRSETAYIPPISNEIDDFYPSVPSQSSGLPPPNTLGGLPDLETAVSVTPIYALAAATQYPPYATDYPDFCVNFYSNTGHFVLNGVGETPDPKEHYLYPEDYRYSPTTGQSMGDYPIYEY
ncbi:hypothetical protein DFH07DRAFT_1012663 [Mycena maculata]|uniref:Uncharacterized protein n=1 Tax=Mycena maculata TaxID=230809 RepID=A0AAD7HDA3_9AGAR|nr:hypothetical protein DFH07DRAFT_1012663 [Mycena maculata]